MGGKPKDMLARGFGATGAPPARGIFDIRQSKAIPLPDRTPFHRLGMGMIRPGFGAIAALIAFPDSDPLREIGRDA